MKKSLRELLLIIAEFYKEPDDNLFNYIKSGDLKRKWDELLGNLNLSTEINYCPNPFENFAQMDAKFKRCFVGPREPFVPPVESLYKQWTTDPKAETPIANQTGYLFGDSAIHIIHLYNQFNIEIPEQYKNTPDHLCLQLEFLALLIGESTEEEVYQYIDDHFDWLETFKEELKLVKNSDYYVCITEQLIRIIYFIRHTKKILL